MFRGSSFFALALGLFVSLGNQPAAFAQKPGAAPPAPAPPPAPVLPD
ncbi:hypothetical protein [Polyangium spumosum]|uniref:Uncharacterized protein n=1 Tax=Polyangium spumosum TaxID=889282 RepID=A0A6N7PNH8_9BACT|nr:hypothetical protein [Polyangium spumosum]MRG92366.1 hypothetical protein [Polyangium spumosum]